MIDYPPLTKAQFETLRRSLLTALDEAASHVVAGKTGSGELSIGNASVAFVVVMHPQAAAFASMAAQLLAGILHGKTNPSDHRIDEVREDKSAPSVN